MHEKITAAPKIFILSGVQGDTRRYRTFHLSEQLRLAGVNVAIGHVTERSLGEKTASAGVLILQRVMWDRQVEALVNQARARGGLVIMDTDDLIYRTDAFQWIDSPDFQDPIRRGLYQENLARNLSTLEHCDAVLASTTYLAGQIRQLGKPVWVHRNGFSLEMFARSAAARENSVSYTRDRIVVGYASGTPTHDRDFAIVRPALQRILADYPQVELWLMGHLDAGPGWDTGNPRLRLIKFTPWRDLPNRLAGLDINLAPLRTENPFSQSKSEIKYMEAGLVGVPTIASPTSAFQEAIRSGENGLLAGTTDEWESALRRLIEDPEYRRSLAKNAQSQVTETYAPWVRASEIVGILNQISELTLGEKIIGANIEIPPVNDPGQRKDLWMDPEIEKRPSLIERGLYSIRVRGVSTLIKEMWIFFRRLISPLIPFQKPNSNG